ncbi:MAG: O-antigen ligase family protein [Saprospiraceae bacterium]|nr:O-antigen ligase family protein [Saprospiraceae bacterium]
MPLSFLKKNPLHHNIALLAAFLLIIGLMISKFLMTLSMIVFIVAGLSNPKRKERWAYFVKHPAYLATTAIFFIILLSGIYTSNWENMAVRLRVALPFLVLPCSFALIGKLPKVYYTWIAQGFIAALVISSIGVLINYAINYDKIQLMIQQSKAVPTPNKDHIRFSLLLCIAIFMGISLLQNVAYRTQKLRTYLSLFAILFLVLTLHILSVRSGLLALYLGILVWIVQMIIQNRRFILGLGLLISLGLAPVLAYYMSPSFRTKFELTRHNIEIFREGNIGEYSDTQRLLSYVVAWEVAQKNIWLGVGMGDLHDEQKKVYTSQYPKLKPKYPHNQFLTFLAGTGIIGLLLFLIAFMTPLFYQAAYKDTFMLCFFALLFSSFITENTLLIASGTAIYTFFLLLNLTRLSD